MVTTNNYYERVPSVIEFNYRMKYRQKISGGIMGTIGYLLSPLSWWNDLYLNIPLAYAVAWIASLAYKPAFLPAFVIAYWITNIAGLILMHKGIEKVARKGGMERKYSRRDFFKDLALSLIYTALIVALVKLHVLQPVGEYFKK